MSFILHPTLARDCAVIGDFALSQALLMNNAHFPWIILVPRREGIREWFELGAPEQIQLLQETNRVAEILARETAAEKINIAALGNQVPQLHVHVIARFAHDAVWPNPVWGAGGAPYDTAQMSLLLSQWRSLFNITHL